MERKKKNENTSHILIVLMAIALAFSFAGCGGGGGEEEKEAAPETVNIGARYNLTGGQASLDQPSYNGSSWPPSRSMPTEG